MAEEEQQGELTPEELLEHIRRMKVSGRDLEQAKLAIESLRAIVPVLEGSVPEDVLRDFSQVTANLQLAYAKAADEMAGESAPEEPEEGATSAPR